MIIERTEHPMWLSNAYLVADEASNTGVLIDGNDELGPLHERVERDGIEITHILLTHQHWDHFQGIAEAKERYGVPVIAHELAAADLDPALVDETLADGAKLEAGALSVEGIYTPGHCAGHLALLVNGADCFTADCLFRGTVGGTRAPGATGFEDLKSSVMDRLMSLPHETRVHPGHKEPTSVGEEWESNPFIRIWRGLDEEGSDTCRVGDDGQEATLVLWAPDYDGGNKAWVRFASGEDAIVGGSQVTRDA
jgi:glyoxylase-like metal-dependent hydrolase (beta-lactamase superfamily II)